MAVGTVVAVNIGRAHREHNVLPALEAVGNQRTAEANGAEALNKSGAYSINSFLQRRPLSNALTDFNSH
jgi:hypothetical protein